MGHSATRIDTASARQHVATVLTGEGRAPGSGDGSQHVPKDGACNNMRLERLTLFSPLGSSPVPGFLAEIGEN